MSCHWESGYRNSVPGGNKAGFSRVETVTAHPNCGAPLENDEPSPPRAS